MSDNKETKQAPAVDEKFVLTNEQESVLELVESMLNGAGLTEHAARLQAPAVEAGAKTNQTLTEAIEWCIAHGNCGPRTRATLIAARAALARASEAAAGEPVTKTYTRGEVQQWRDDALEAAAAICDRYGLQGYGPAHDIRLLKKKLDAAPQPASTTDDSAALLDWLIDNSATYASKSVPLQLIAKEHHPVHQTPGVDGYRKGMRAAIREAMQGVPQPASEQQVPEMLRDELIEHTDRVIALANEVPVASEQQVKGAASPKDQAVYQSIADNYAKDLQGGEQQAALVWTSVADRLPESGKTVLATYQNRLGKLRRIRAQYIAPKTREQNIDNDELDGEYDEATDTYYWNAGWYECIDNWGDYSHVAVCEGNVTHWMPMPDAPALAAAKGDGHADK
jgi:hypothetical protein